MERLLLRLFYENKAVGFGIGTDAFEDCFLAGDCHGRLNLAGKPDEPVEAGSTRKLRKLCAQFVFGEPGIAQQLKRWSVGRIPTGADLKVGPAPLTDPGLDL